MLLESMVKLLISYSKLANNNGQVSVTFENIRDFQFSKYCRKIKFSIYMFIRHSCIQGVNNVTLE